ncbi:glutamate synthase subunit beta [Paenibacillus mucilaginosus]|uniref:GltB n=1 Tax=Paenibacillus mucilaginosus (strain KNP414) TaxID=1036673 RepID=F8FPQ8_PAEMK|nr:glutamate synthase subunit beta [Paenibacillus mucilaginosus]AEI45875.1 GltB [Paenibacillus mucilaginosus KNP414]MCG7217787.1 glutamate synthase subunit beta [Paenibacillus mucilaginosus]WDM27241.1 glutamate synthase subunit beta [Paenibacillus mucilaginosus]
MGKPTGFMDYEREVPIEHAPLLRIAHWQEFGIAMPEIKLQQQGARCMDCGIPFCHTGTILSGMAAGCPVQNLIPEWNDLIYRGQWREALERLHKTNNFPEFTGRVCPAPCEGSCTVGLHGKPVTIKNIEKTIIDKGFAEGWVVPQPPARRTGKTVAVVGSGPSGLACAAQLNKAGHLVTVYERADRAGGLLMYGIPNMKLDKKVVQRRIDLLAAEGVVFITGTEIGRDIPASQLREDYDAVVLCGGATQGRDLRIEGRELGGIHLAMEFLSRNTKSLLDSEHKDGAYLSAEGKDVVVIGGGDTGTDCVGTAIRHKCRSVTQFEILPRPPETRQANNPWPEWPKVLKTDYGQEEAAALHGGDPRRYLINTKRFTGDDAGQVAALHTVLVDWQQDEAGRFVPVEVPGSEQVVPAQLVLLAMGFTGPESPVLEQLGVERDERSNARAAYGRYATSAEGVFAAGDMRRGQSLVVWAIQEGREAAREVDRYLMGATNLP